MAGDLPTFGLTPLHQPCCTSSPEGGKQEDIIVHALSTGWWDEITDIQADGMLWVTLVML